MPYQPPRQTMPQPQAPTTRPSFMGVAVVPDDLHPTASAVSPGPRPGGTTGGIVPPHMQPQKPYDVAMGMPAAGGYTTAAGAPGMRNGQSTAGVPRPATPPPANGRPFELPRNAGGPPPIMPPGNTGIVPPHMQNAGNIPAGGSPGQRNGGAVTGIPRMPASAPGTRMPMRNAQPQRYNGVPAKPAQPTGRPTGSRMGQMIGMMMRGRR